MTKRKGVDGHNQSDDTVAQDSYTNRTHRQVADILGIGRARVFFLEQQALRKMQDALRDLDIDSTHTFDSIPVNSLRKNADPQPTESPGYSPLHGWLKVHRIISLNNGSEDVQDVLLAYRFLKESQETLMRPPVIVTGRQPANLYVIQAVAEQSRQLFVRCWPSQPKVKRSVADLHQRRVTILTDSIFDTDAEGDFDVPLIVCCVITDNH